MISSILAGVGMSVGSVLAFLGAFLVFCILLYVIVRVVSIAIVRTIKEYKLSIGKGGKHNGKNVVS